MTDIYKMMMMMMMMMMKKKKKKKKKKEKIRLRPVFFIKSDLFGYLRQIIKNHI